MTLAVIYTGWGNGFQITLIGMNILTFFAEYVKQYFGNWACISDVELYSIYKDYNIVIEEELVVDEIKVNEPCPGSN